MTVDEAIAHAREVAEIQRNNDKLNKTLGKSSPYYNTDCIKCAKEHEHLAEWLEELKALRLLLDWAIECDFGLDSFPAAYAKYKHTLTDNMTYKDMMIQIAKCVVAEEIKEK